MFVSGALAQTNRIDSLNAVAFENRSSVPHTALAAASEAISSARSIGYADGEIQARFHWGFTSMRIGRYEAAMDTLSQALELTKNRGPWVSSILRELTYGERLRGNYPSAMDHALSAMEAAEDEADSLEIAASHVEIGRVNLSLGELDQAKIRFDQAREIHNRLNPEECDSCSQFADVLNFTGVWHLWNSESDDEVLALFQEAQRVYSDAKDMFGVGNALGNKGIVFFFRRQHETSIVHYEQALDLAEAMNDSTGITQSLQRLSNALRRLQEYDRAVELAQRSFDLAILLGNKYLASKAATELRNSYAKKNEWELAYRFRGIESDYEDSLLNEQNALEIGRLQAEHGFERQAEAEAQIRRRRNSWLFAGMGFLLLGMVGGLLYARTLKSKNRLIEEQTNALSEASQSQAMAMEAGNVALWSYDILSGEATFSSQYYEMLGFAEGDFDDGGNPWVERIHPDDKERDDQQAEAYLNEGPSADARLYESQVRMKHADGTWIWIMVRGRIAERLEDGTAKRWVGTLLDISDRVKITEDLKEARAAADQANTAKSTFLANMSHEIRTPMNGIMGFSELMSSHVTSTTAKKYLGYIRGSSKTLLSLINDILDLSKVEAGKLTIIPEPVEFRSLINELSAIFSSRAEEKGILFNSTIGSDVPDILLIDPTRVKQVVINLLGNALKFTKQGHVKIEVNAVQNSGTSAFDLSIAIEDSGIGIRTEDQDKIFRAFEQQTGQKASEFGGTGLGLSITKSLVTLMGGHISIESELGEGTVITVHLKGVEVASTLLEDESGYHVEYEFEPASVLIADDIELNRELIKGYLEGYSLDLRLVSNGNELIEAVSEHLPDCILTDFRMPGMSGLEAAKRLRANDKSASIPILMLTAAVTESDRDLVGNVVDAYLTKPVGRGILLKALAAHLPHHKIETGVPVTGSGDGSLQSENIDDPQSLLGLLEDRYAKLVSFHDRMSISDFEELALNMTNDLQPYGSPTINSWCESLSSAASVFDLDTMANELKRFHELKSQLASLVEE